MLNPEKSETVAKPKRIQTLKRCVVYFAVGLLCSALFLFTTVFHCLGSVIMWSWHSNSRLLLLLLNITIITLATESRLLTALPSDAGDDQHDFSDELGKKNRTKSSVSRSFLTEAEDKPPPEETKRIIYINAGSRPESETANFCRRREGFNYGENIPAGQLMLPAASDSLAVVEASPPMEEENESKPAMTDEELKRRSEELIALKKRSEELIARIRSQIHKGM